jgi:diaminopimelate epimerase
MSIAFTKMSGCGNDFVIVDEAALPAGVRLEDLGAAICALGTGVGADGLAVIRAAGEGGASYSVDVINRSGAPAELCGNASRCVARYALDRGIAGKRHAFRTVAGLVEAEILGDRVTVGLPDPTPIVLDMPVALDGETWRVDFLELGVPHAVLWWEGDVETAPVGTLGERLRHAPEFAKGANVDFAAIQGETLRVRTFERGVEAETLACGTGSSASAIAAVRRGLLARPVRVKTSQGGLLTVDFNLSGDQASRVRLSGPADYVFEGRLHEDFLRALG